MFEYTIVNFCTLKFKTYQTKIQGTIDKLRANIFKI